MARYETPPDPRESDFRSSRKRQMRTGLFDWVSLVGLLLGLLITVIAIFVAWQMAKTFLAREALDVVPVTEPTIIVLTAPPSPTATPLGAQQTPTPITPLTEDDPVSEESAETPTDVAVGFYSQVANTGGIGVTVRGGPSTDNVRLVLLNEGEVALVIGGPQDGGGFTWWQIQMDDGTEGWVAAAFLVPAAAPEASGNE